MEITPIYIITFFLLIVAIGIIMLVLLYQKRQLQYFREKQELHNTFQQELLRTQLEIQEQTLKTISQEIHDNIGQVLSLVKLNVNTMECDDPVSLEVKISDTKQLVGKAIQDLRDLSKSFNVDFVTDMGLIKSIEHELIMVNKVGKFTATLVQEGAFHPVSSQKELILFRIFQEAVNNIIKHSQASVVDVLVNYFPDKFFLQITDNGKGFDISEINRDQNRNLGLGIRNMENRSRIIGADYKIVSEPGKGTVVTIELPIA